MRIPYFRAKDKDSDLYVEGFYAEFPEHNDPNNECKLIHAIMVVVPDATPIPEMPMLGLMGIQDQFQEIVNKRNTLNYCTIDISTLQQIGEVEIGSELFKPDAYIKSPNSSIIIS